VKKEKEKPAIRVRRGRGGNMRGGTEKVGVARLGVKGLVQFLAGESRMRID